MAALMTKMWLYADPHFYHEGIVKFTNFDGTKVRPWDDAEVMSEWMINAYNELVHPDDRVYILGDVAMNRKALDRSLPRLLGRKVLIKGNHDIDKLSYYAKYFEDIRGVDNKKGYVLTHVPLHPNCLDRWGVNIHGHLHGNKIEDKRYKCVSVEHTGFKPILLEEVLSW